MIYLKWLVLAVLDWLLLFTVPIAAPVIAAFTKEQPYGLAPYTWGWIWGTYDNPPQGDRGDVTKQSLFPNKVTGFKGYINRVWWMIRNPLYGLAAKTSVLWATSHTIQVLGKPSISDKYKVPGWYFAKAYNTVGKCIAFEFYMVKPWANTRDLRVRLGWKFMTSKTDKYGFAQLVNTCNPFDGYGDN